MKVVICWSHISGYMAACWRALAATEGVEVFVLAFASDAVAPFDPALLDGIPHRLMDDKERLDPKFVHGAVAGQKPDVLVISGWSNPGLRPLAANPAFAGVFKIMTMDTALRYDWKQAVGRRLLRRYLRNFDRIAVAGERAFAYARYLGFADRQIRKGTYGIDFAGLAGCLERRAAGPWPRRFLYVGRYAPEKGLDTLIDAYARYRAGVNDPWDLACCGRGPEGHRLGAPGVTDLGFVPPADQAAVFAGAGAFVMPSRFEPWGVAIAEAAAAGLPLVCSTACGAGVELLRDAFNGYAFATGDADELARRLKQIHDCPDLPDWGRRGRALAAAHDATLWPLRVLDGLLPGQAAAAKSAGASPKA